MTTFTRRQVTGQLVASAVTAASLPRLSFSQSQTSTSLPSPHALQFPQGFLWGCATSAYQIEGAVDADGRGRTIWDAFAHTPGKTFNGQTGDIADDSYHRFPEDVKLLKELGVKTYRFSIAWSRIFPQGSGPANDKGMDYYERLTDELLANEIIPFATLFHWDLPLALPGGWQSRDTAHAFADYAGFVAKRLSDRVRNFMTTNEFVCFTDLSYKIGQFAPGLKLADAAVNQVRHHALLAHGLGVQAMRAAAAPGTEIGLAENPRVFVPVIETAADIDAAKRAFRLENAPFITAVLEGKYPDEYLEREGANAPKVASGDMAAVGSRLDFVGLNVYQPEYARADGSKAGYAVERRPTSYPRMASPWLYVGPEAIYWAVRSVTELWNPKSLYITENGCSSEDYQDAEGHIEDTDRVMFLRNYLTQLHRAVTEKYPVKGYFLWSLMDNFEWADGFSNPFGIYHVDFSSQKRTPKRSALWYREVIARNAVV